MAESDKSNKSNTNIVWTNETVKKTDFMVFREASSQNVTNVVAPNGLQVGLFDQNFLADLNVTGHITGSGQIYSGKNILAQTGFTGSLTKLIDGTDFLRAGSNITLTTDQSNGSITIASSATIAGTLTNALTAGDGIQMNSGTTFDGGAAKTMSLDLKSGGGLKITSSELELDINGLSATLSSPAKEDMFAVADADDSNNSKKFSLSNLAAFQAGWSNSSNYGIASFNGRFYLKPEDLGTAAAVDPAADHLIIDDADDSSSLAKKTTIASVVDAIRGTTANTGLNSSSGVLSIDINSVSTAAEVLTTDTMLIYDASATAIKKASVADIRGAGSTMDISGAAVEMTEADLDSGDLLAVADISDDSPSTDEVKKISIRNFGEYLGGGTNYGIVSATTGKLYLNPASMGTAASLDVANDTLIIDDVSDGSNLPKKITIPTLVDGIRGTNTATGLTSSSGVLTVDINNMNAASLQDSDTVMVFSGGGLKKTTVSDIQGAGQAIDISAISGTIDENGLVKADSLAVNDSGTTKKLTIEDLSDWLVGETNGGIANDNTSGKLTLDLNNLPAANITVAEDSIPFINIDGQSKKESITDLITAVAGNGLAASSGVLAVGVDDSTIEINSDSLRVKDSGITNAKLTNSSVTVAAGDGLKTGGAVALGSSVTLDIDVSDFAGTGLQDEGSENLAVKYGTTAGTAAQGNTTLTINPGVGLSGTGGTLPIGSNMAFGLDLAPEEIAGLGLNYASNKLTNYLAGGTGITIASGSGADGALIINSSVTDTTYTAGDGLDLSGTTFSLDLKANGGLSISNTELEVNPGHFAGTGLSGVGPNMVIDNTIVATISGSLFSGPVVAPVLSGSLQSLADGTAYILAGDNISIATGSSGAITIAASVDGGGSLGTITQVTAGTGLTGGGTSGNVSLAISNSIIATLTGSQFTGNVGITGSLGVTAGLSGSLTQLTDGSSYLIAGNNIQITTGSSGAVTITGTANGDMTSVVAGTGLTGGGASGDVTLNVNNSVIATLTGSQFSGNVGVTGSLGITGGLSGSLTHLHDGSSYLIAGSGIAITSGSSGSVTIATSAAAGIIGAAEDGSYTDGLFTDFTSSTPVGTAVDRFNEILSLLVPAPAPDLDDVDVNSDGADVKLSFGTSNDQSSASPAYANVAASAGISAAVDVNGDYETANSGNNLRAAVFNGATDIIGDLNEDIPANVTSPSNRTNYPVNSFGNADIGSLILEVNGSNLYTLDLTAVGTGTGASGSGSKNHVNGNGSGFINVSASTVGTFDNGDSFAQFKHRTGQWKVGAADQRNGWNYIRVKHDKGGGSVVTTNYVEWVNDNDSTALAASGNSLAFTGAGSLDLSGVQYYTSGQGRYQVNVDHAYKYVYDNNNITFTTSNSGTNSNVTFNISAISKPTINTGGGESHTKQIQVDETTSITADYILGGSVTAGISVSHPIKSNLSNSGQASASNILVYNISNSSTALNETFDRENFRIQSGSYGVQGDISSGAWNSATDMVAPNTNYQDGLQFYRRRLYSPKNTLNSGNFSTYLPASNPNYSGISGIRTFFRKFQNTSGGAVRDMSFTATGTGTIVPQETAVGSNANYRVFFKLPEGSTSNSGWLDAAKAFSYQNTSDFDGCSIGTFNGAAGNTNYLTFGTGSIANNEYVLAKIETNSNWNAYLENFVVTFGAVSSVAVDNPAATLDINESAGVTAKLSFGDTLTPGSPAYASVENTAGNSQRNENQTYTKSGTRYGVFGGGSTTDITGEINFDKAASGNAYPQYSFGAGNAHLGTLKLHVNGVEKHSINLTTMGSFTNSFNGNGSGFPSISAATVGKDSNNLPDYTKFYRTGNYKIAYADQRNGWNYARIVHHDGSTAHNTAYVEWINDYSNPTITYSSVSVGNFSSASTYKCSGVKYFISPTGRFDYTVANLYKYVYSGANDAISYPTTTNCTVTAIATSGDGISNGSVSAASTSIPALDTSVADSYDDNLTVQATFSFDQATSIPGESEHTVTLIGRTVHPIKGNTDTSSTQSGVVLAANFTDNSSNLSEPFNGEAKRLQDTTYANQAAVTGGSNNWNSNTSMNGGDSGHNTGLIVYNGKLKSPQKVGLGSDLGDFRDTSNGGSLVAPSSNPDYSSLSNATRNYIRWFKNETGGSKTDLQVVINGTGTIVSSGTGLSGNNLKVFFKVPQTGDGFSTGWMDMAVAFSTGQNGDNAGCLVGSFDSSLNATNSITFGTQSVGNNEYILIKVVADKTWTGNIDQITVSWT